MSQVTKNGNTSKIEIVKLSPSEWLSYKVLRLRSLKEDPQSFLSSYEKELLVPDDRWRARLSNDKWLFFAKMDGQLVGMMGAFQTDKDKQNQAANIYGVFVVHEARGKRISVMLMNKLLDFLKDQSIKTVNLSVNQDQLAAVTLYRKFGFDLTGQENMMLGDGIEHTELLMTRQL